MRKDLMFGAIAILLALARLVFSADCDVLLFSYNQTQASILFSCITPTETLYVTVGNDLYVNNYTISVPIAMGCTVVPLLVVDDVDTVSLVYSVCSGVTDTRTVCTEPLLDCAHRASVACQAECCAVSSCCTQEKNETGLIPEILPWHESFFPDDDDDPFTGRITRSGDSIEFDCTTGDPECLAQHPFLVSRVIAHPNGGPCECSGTVAVEYFAIEPFLVAAGNVTETFYQNSTSRSMSFVASCGDSLPRIGILYDSCSGSLSISSVIISMSCNRSMGSEYAACMNCSSSCIGGMSAMSGSGGGTKSGGRKRGRLCGIGNMEPAATEKGVPKARRTDS